MMNSLLLYTVELWANNTLRNNFHVLHFVSNIIKMIGIILFLLSALAIITGSEAVHINVIEGNKTYKTIYCTMPQIVQVSNVTDTTCNIFWNKPIGGDEFLDYDIYSSKDEENMSRYFRITSLKKIRFSIPNLEPGSKYKITVISKIYNQILTQNSTDCITRSNIGPLRVVEVTTTSCKLQWRKPNNDSEIITYFITPRGEGMTNNFKIHNSSHHFIDYTVQNLKSGSRYNISVYANLNNLEPISTTCDTLSSNIVSEAVKVLFVTNTTCEITWKKPTESNGLVRYIVDVSGIKILSLFFYSIDKQISILIEHLNPSSKYYITIFAKIGKQQFSPIHTICNTKP
ncbi:tenascin-like isoform X2 [Leptopilina heterotoma]|uniref:tenascin-like isoform X2 n=1 Tax=Leptopilina heterotoma TaxID=63436 RepID=UPI001CA8330C|nr:tenascin-like isoform X2 [Leptopilina heterotoma]